MIGRESEEISFIVPEGFQRARSSCGSRRNISLYSRSRPINRKRSEYTKEAEKRMLAGIALNPPHNCGEGCEDPMATRTDRASLPKKVGH